MISRFAGALCLALLLPAALSAAEVVRARSGPITSNAVAAPPANPGNANSQWALLTNIHLEDVLYPQPVQGGTTPSAQLLSTTVAVLQNGYNVLITMVKLDNPEPRAAGVRPVDYVRCYEYFTSNLSQDGTRCFVLQPKAL